MINEADRRPPREAALGIDGRPLELPKEAVNSGEGGGQGSG